MQEGSVKDLGNQIMSGISEMPKNGQIKALFLAASSADVPERST